MMKMSEHAEPVVRWWVRYEPDSDPIEVLIPHAWRQDMPVAHEGPVVYQTNIKVPRGRSSLVFHGVSYQAEVQVNGTTAVIHRGIWDGFVVPLDGYAGQSVSVEVIVIKNGGRTFPVDQVASGFLPYVFHTFGGMHGTVDLVRGTVDLEYPPCASRVTVESSQIYVDGKPFYMRGLLHWGWYPELGHPNPPPAIIHDEIFAIKERGFNLVKFCLWLPPHSYLEALRAAGMFAWIELPLWNPKETPEFRRQITDEFSRIVRQYRRHDNIVCWTVGCELGGAISQEFRAHLTQTVRNLTACPLVKDSSGGAEMYGGDLREYGDYYDYHPYCETSQYPAVLDSLLPGARKPAPLLLGEFADADAHRDLSRLGDEIPYWASSLSELNPVGVRWQYDLPAVVVDSRFANNPTRSRHSVLMESARKKALFMRKHAVEAVRARDVISGYVITGARDTPISISGFFDDWGDSRFTRVECESWNGTANLFVFPNRHPIWYAGGNRAGWSDPYNHFAGTVFLRIGLHSEAAITSGLCWRVVDTEGRIAAEGTNTAVTVPNLSSREVGIVMWDAKPGSYRLEVEFGEAKNVWPIWVVEPQGRLDAEVYDPAQVLTGVAFESFGASPLRVRSAWEENDAAGVFFLRQDGTTAMPFWREAAYEFNDDPLWADVPFANQWTRLLPISGDRALESEWLDRHLGKYQVLMNRIDVRTYRENPVLVRSGNRLVTSLRPFGGLGDQPSSLANNPSGFEWIRSCLAYLKTSP